MKKWMRKLLLSALAVTTAATAITATVLNIDIKAKKVSASTATESTVAVNGFEMVYGASIRMANPLGLRFIAEMGSDVYDDLMTSETGVDKRMGMFIMPYSYLDGVEGDYQNVETKIDLAFYDSANAEVENKIYQYEDVYRANGVIANLKLQNYDKDFIGIAYIAETSGGTTTYTFAEFNKADNVRCATYVAIEAYEDYEDTNARGIFNEYVKGAHLYKSKGMTQTVEGKFSYNGTEYDTVTAAATAANVQFGVSLNPTYIKKVGDSKALTATITDNGTAVAFNGAHAILKSSGNADIVSIEDGKAVAVSKGTTTATAAFMGTSATCDVIAEAITFDTLTAAPSYITGSRIQTFSIAADTTKTGNTLRAVTTADSTGDTALYIETAQLGAFFEDKTVDYFAFDVMTDSAEVTGATTNLYNVYYHNYTSGSGAWTRYDASGNSQYNYIPNDAFKTYYMPRAVYQSWVDNNLSSARFIMAGGEACVFGGDSFYIDNLRGVTADEYNNSIYDFERGNMRNGGTTHYYYSGTSNGWDIAINNLSAAGFTNTAVFTGGRALTFTKNSGVTAISFNHTTDTAMETAMRTAVYVTIDLYVPESSDAKIIKNNYHSPLQEGWNTVYTKVDASDNEWFRFTDTTGGTYVFDNIQFITEEEYYANAYGFESGAGVLRTAEIGDTSTNGGVFYYYGGADATATYSFAFLEGSGTGDVATVSNPRYASDVAHSGKYSLAFDKGSGYMYVTMRTDSTAFSKLSGGFEFWIYSTTAIDGVNTVNFINGYNNKFNGGAGITIPANTWTKVVVTAEDMNPTRFLIMQGSWSGTVYIDDIKPVQTTSVTLNSGDSSTSMSLVYGEAYTLPTPTNVYRDFLGWYDEGGNEVAMSGTWNTQEAVTLTAHYADKVSFEDGVVPSYLTKSGSTESLSVVDMDTTDGSKALKIQSTASGTSPALYATVEFLASFFDDENVDYIAFNAKTGSSRANNFRRYTMHSSGSMDNVTYEYDVAYNGIYADAWKTFYFSREDYDYWVANSVTANSLIATGGFDAGDCIYLDNIKAATAEEYADGEYGFEIGGVRLDGNNLLFYTSRGAGTWQMGILPGAAFTSYSYTNETVSDGVRAFQFTPAANTTTLLRFNTNTVTQMQTDIMDATGYYAFDLYVPAGSDATLTYQTTTWPGATPKKGDWTTIYVNNNTTFIKITDTTGSTYAVDNFRSITADEYTAATLGFEANAGGLRDNVEASNVFYYYGGADHTANTYSICASSSTLTEVHFDSEKVHSGDYSLAFTKTNGALTLQMRADSTTYALLKNGFTFWIYSTVGLNGISADNFINGNSTKFNDGAGMSVSANTWTQVTVTAADITHATSSDGPCPFLRFNGSTAGTIYIDDFVALPYEEPEVLEYKATVAEETEDGVRKGILLDASTHDNSNLEALPQGTSDTEDMSYIKFDGSYGLNDFLVFDFTGDNVPLMSFFTSEVTNSVYNQEENADMKGWIVANGMTTMRGLPYSGTTSNLANRLNIIGPYKISNLYDNTTGNTLAQVRTSEGSAASPSPITMPTLQASYGNTPFRMIVGWIENGSYMNLRMVVYNLTNGQEYLNYNLNKSIAKADWEGDIALYGHFARETYIDALYPIEEDTTIDAVVAKYTPTTLIYNGEWDGDKLILNQSIYNEGDVNSDAANSPTSADMSYIAFNGSYGLNDYVVFDMTGDNMPIVSFFNNTVTNTVFNNASAGGTIADESVRGWVWFNGLYRNNGVVYGGASTTNVHWQRLTLVGSHKVVGFDNNNNDFRVCLGSATDVNPLSIYSLQNVTDTYRIILGIGKHASSTSKVYVEMAAINMVTGATVYQYQWEVSSVDFEEGSIALHGQFGKETVLDKVFGVEEDTTLAALIAKYAKDFDYSEEDAVTLDRYAYSSLSDGQWTLDGTDQVTDPTDYRTLESTYTTYKDAGFNILLAQDMISTDGTKDVWEASANKTYMDNAYNAGLKVILTDWHLQILSAPLKVSGSSVVASDSTYVPWIIGTDASATTGAAADYLGYLSSLGITVDSTRFATRDALDKFVYDQLAPYKDHPAFYGVMLADEPSYHNAYCYGEIYKSIKRVMPDCYVQYNLLPMEHSFGTIQYRYPGVNDIGKNITNAQIETAYKAYVESYLDTMGTNYIQYDDYPFKSAEEGVFWTETVPYVDPTSLRNIQLIAEIAKERGLDVKVVSQSSVMKSGGEDGAVHIRQVTENDARWLNNYLMGFGVKQINYFTYWTKRASTSDGEYFVDGGSFVNRDGTTTALYDFMKTIMADNTAFAPTITHFDYSTSQIFGSDNDSNLNNEHISWSSSLTATASFRWLTSVTTDLEYTLVTELYDENNYNYMYMVMNTIDPNSGGTQSVTVTLDSSVTKFYVYDQSGNRTEQTGNSYTVSLTAGQAVYIMPYAW